MPARRACWSGWPRSTAAGAGAPGGHRSCAHWLSVRTGYDLRTARGYVRVARSLETLPATRASMARGRLAYSQVRALTRVATPETGADLLELAEGCTTATLERRVRAWTTAARREAADEPDPTRGSGEPPSAREAHREAARRRADAPGLVAERALAAGLGGGAGEDGEDDDEDGDDDVPVSGTRAERYQAFLFVDADTLAGEAGAGPASPTRGAGFTWTRGGRRPSCRPIRSGRSSATTGASVVGSCRLPVTSPAPAVAS